MAQDPIIERLAQQQLTLLVEQEGKLIFASDRPGLAALRDALFFHPELLDGSEVALPGVGLAAAYLLILGKAGEVHAQALSREAKDALAEEGIEHRGSVVKKLPQASAEPMATLDARAREAVTPQAFVDDLKRLSY